MEYTNCPHFDHTTPERTGVIITNLGTPAAPTASALRRYLRQFLSDPRVVEFPRWLWWLILNVIILRVRPARSARAYASVWLDAGSPLAIYTKKQADALRDRLKPDLGNNVIINWAMRYGEPSIAGAIQAMMDSGVRRLLILPLYPQYSGATTASTFDALAEDFTRRRWIPELRFITGYHDHPLYIEALAASVERHWNVHGRTDKLVFSYHGVPLRYLHRGDPYHCQCHTTTRLVAERLQLDEREYLTTFQSRFGREEWLRPYMDETMKSLPGSGVKSVQVICPGFSSDCLETIEEIGLENREYFLHAGGERYEYIPALNAEPMHIDLLADLVKTHLQGWNISPDVDRTNRHERFEKHPYNQKPNSHNLNDHDSK